MAMYRRKTELLALILSVAKDKPTSKSRLGNAAFMSHKQVMDCISILAKNGMLKVSAGGTRYQATRKGVQYLLTFQKMRTLSGQIDAMRSELYQLDKAANIVANSTSKVSIDSMQLRTN
jgi:predicted transcriptional regulator